MAFLIGRLFLTLSVVGVLAASVIGAVSSVPASPEKSTATPIAGGTKAQRALLREILRAMGGTQIQRIRVESSTDGLRLVMWPPRLDRSRANVSVRVGWDAHVTAFTFARLSRARGGPSVAGYSILGQRTAFGSTKGRTLPLFDRRKIVRPVGRAVKRSGARLIEFNLFRPRGPAFAVVVEAPKPARFIELRLAPIIAALNSVSRRIDGFYIAVADAKRSVVFAYGRVDLPPGLNSTTLYVREDLTGCAESLPVQNEVAPDSDPPCPRG